MDDRTNTARQGETRADIYQRITDSIAAAIESGAGEWRMPWHSGMNGQALVMPVNVVTGRSYRGVNTVVLWATAQASGYGMATWGTYRQWKERGAQVRKGEQASPVVFWKITDRTEAGDNGETQEEEGRSPGKRFLARGYSVFNAAQVEGFETPALPATPEAQRIAHAEAFFAALGADIRHGGHQLRQNVADDAGRRRRHRNHLTRNRDARRAPPRDRPDRAVSAHSP